MSWPISDSMLSLPALSMLPSGSVLHLKTSTVDSKARTASGLNRLDAIETKIAPLQNTVILRLKCSALIWTAQGFMASGAAV